MGLGKIIQGKESVFILEISTQKETGVMQRIM